MSVAVSTAIAIGGIAAAGSSIAGAKMASGATKDAAKTQAASADKALAIQKQMYDQTRTDEAPYRQLGAGAVGLLGQGLGLPAQQQTWAPAPATAAQPAAPAAASGGGFLGGLGHALGALTPPGLPHLPGTGGGSPQPGQAQTASGYVQMKSPTGQVKPVASGDVAHYQQLGAQIVGNA